MHKDSSIKILFITHSTSLYGAQKSLLDLILGLDKKRYAPVVVAPNRGALSDELENMGIQVYYLPFVWWVSLPGQHGVFHRLKKNLGVCRRIITEGLVDDVDLLYTNSAVVPLGALLSLRTRIPHVWHFREFVEEDYGFKFDFPRALCELFVRKCSDAVVFNSVAVKRKFSRYLKTGQGSVVYNGVVDECVKDGLSVVKKDSAEPVRICIVGSIAVAKGQDVAIAALKVLSEHMQRDVVLHLVGSGLSDEIARLQKLAGELGVADQIVWEGFCSDMQTLYERSDFCWVCSRSEAFGRVIVEAMSYGVPVIACASGGIPEIITDGENGLLYAVGDAEALARKTMEIAADEDKYFSVQRQGLKTARTKFNKQRYVSEITSLIDSVLRCH